MAHLPTMEIVADRIHIVRSQRVMLDADLAALYGVPTKRLNEQVRRNSDRFPGDFMFRLSAAEWGALNRSQIATGSQRHRDPASLPNAFTEHGCLMLANVLRSARAGEASILVVRAFVRLRGVLAANTELAARVDQLALHLEKHDRKVAVHDQAILSLLAEIRRLTRFPESSSRPIGFTADLSRTSKGRKS
jgi:hypothetical protein